MIKSPYLKPFNTEGGTLYVFPSVSKDLTKTFVGSDYDFKFSHFACLNLPNIYSGNYTNTSPKGLYISTLMGDNAPSSWESGPMGNAIAENLQNYVMNFETAILNGIGDNDDYDPDILTTVSEKVFWNWLQKVGAIKFTDDGTAEDCENEDRTVQFIGNLDIMNTVEINGDSFEELYINVPSSVGASTNVYFRTGEMTDDKNYLNKSFNVASSGLNIDPYNIIGRTSQSNDLRINAFYDISGIYKGDIGHTIDFRDTTYDDGEGINNMNSKSLDDFQFNAILIYYDICQKTMTSGVKRVATNLYGILFLDNVQTSSDVSGSKGYIQRYTKKKETVYGNGNSYVFKLDLKLNTSPDVSSIDFPDIGNVDSMALYTKSLEQLQKCIDLFYEQRVELKKLSERIDVIENLIMGIDTIASLKEDIQRLYDYCDGNSVVNTSTILGLIDNNSRRINSIINGEKNLKLQYDTDVIQPGNGIGIKKTANKVVISSEQKYSINPVYVGTEDEVENSPSYRLSTIDENKTLRIPLKPGENFAIIYIDDLGDSRNDVNIYVDEETNGYSWEVGQSMKIFFDCDAGSLRFENDDLNGINIKPNGKNGSDTLKISGSDFTGNNLIEIVCVNETTMGEKKFIYLIK